MTLHQPVMLKEMLEWLQPKSGGVYIDGTFGRGGYSAAILQSATSTVYAFDRDAEAIASGAELQPLHGDRLHLVHTCYSAMEEEMAARGVQTVDGVVLDLGVSSPQLDDAARGFSFRHDGPLDMRMGQSGKTAADLVNRAKEDELGAIIFNYGEERFARRVARAIVKARGEDPFTRTQQLAKVIRAVVPHARDGIDPATRTFQALRIAVNDELGELERGLAAAQKMLRHGGRLVVVTFHSLEDRAVKNFLRDRSGKMPALSRHMPAANNNQAATFRILTAKPIPASEEEARGNPRAASAKLRAAERIFSETSTESLDVNPERARK
jgi:16S rRNA (cytosine1402-N4)-methyltransferase